VSDVARCDGARMLIVTRGSDILKGSNKPCGQQRLFALRHWTCSLSVSHHFAGMSQNNAQVRLLPPLLFHGEQHATPSSSSCRQTARKASAEVDEQYPITHLQYEDLKLHLKLHWVGIPVGSRDPRVTDQLLESWGLHSWKEYVLDQYLNNY